MDKATFDALISSMLESQNGVSDLIFIQGKPALVESHGKLHDFSSDIALAPLTAEFIAAIVDLIVENDPRLLSQYETSGACDTNYDAEGMARFRVNIFKQNSGRSIVMRLLAS